VIAVATVFLCWSGTSLLTDFAVAKSSGRHQVLWHAGPASVAGLAALAATAGNSAVAVFAAAGAAALANAVSLASAMVAPLLRRREIRAAGVPLPLFGSRPVVLDIGARLSSALEEVAAEAAAPLQYGDLPERFRADIGDCIRREAERLCPERGGSDPILGRGAASYLRRDIVALSASHRPGFSIPLVLRAALALDRLADAVCVFDRLAVVLPVGSPLAFTPDAGAALSSKRRSRRPPYRETFSWLGDRGAWAGAVDWAWSDAVADRLMAWHLKGLADHPRRHEAIRAFGIERFIKSARSKPVQEDSFGRLYRIGPSNDPAAFVEVADATLMPNGERRRYWLSVPPHMATAHEAVAWTFQCDVDAYGPVAET
jgi:hypothetical protein